MRLSRHPAAVFQRRWRAKLRRTLLEQFGNFCGANSPAWGCGANGGVRLEFAHRVAIVHTSALPRSQWVGMDRTLREVRANPNGFMLLCRPCHLAADRTVFEESYRKGHP